MSFNLDCLNSREDLPIITNRSTKFLHPTFPINENNLISKLSKFFIDLSFTSNDLQSILKGSPISSSKFLSSLIIYTSVVLFILFVSVIIFYVLSGKRVRASNRSRWQTFHLILFYILSVLIFVAMIVVLGNVHRSKANLHQSIEQISTQFNSTILSKDLLTQVQHFSSKATPLLVDGSKSILFKAFVDHYQIVQLNGFVKNIHEHLQPFNSLMFNNEILRKIFKEFTNSYEHLLNLNTKLCHSINGNHSVDIEKKLSYLMNFIEEQFNFLVNVLKEDLLKKAHWNFEDQIHSIITLLSTVTLTVISLLTFIPFLFILLLTAHYLYASFNQQVTIHRLSHPHRLRSLNVQQLQSIHSHHRHPTRSGRRHRSTKKSHRQESRHSTAGERSYSLTVNDLIPKKCRTSRRDHFFLCSIRVGFGVVVVLSVIVLLMSSVFYGLNMFLSSSCQLVHSDQAALISLLTGHLEKVVQSVDDLDLNTTVIRLIDDCRNGIHFSEHFFEKYSSQLNEQFLPIAMELNEKIADQLQQSSQLEKISSQLQLFNQLTELLPSTNLQTRLILIQNDLQQIEKIFQSLNERTGQLSNEFLEKTFAKLRVFFGNVIGLNVDSCPLPLNEMMKIDQLICHQTANDIDGLWLKLVLFVVAILFIVCIFGLYLFQQIFHQHA